MGASKKLESKVSELPHVNGDIIFGAFFILWIALILQQALRPLPMLSFERWMYNGIGMPSPTPEWTKVNFWVPGVCTFLYFTMLLHMPECMKNRERPSWLKKVIFFWNILLSLCSSWAAMRITGQIFNTDGYNDSPIKTDGAFVDVFHNMVCDLTPANTCRKSEKVTCNYLMLFCMSKIPEMIDTLWLILGKKRVIFLHWFHHSSVMWFCWLAWTYVVPMGIIFALMNLSVHSIMYAWYALAAADKWLAVGLKPKKCFSQTVTVLQILQMIAGFSLTIYVHERKDCGNVKLVTRYAWGMYGVYIILFIHFFYRAYCKKRKPALKKPPYAQDRLFVECTGKKISGDDNRPVGGVPKPDLQQGAKKPRVD